MSRPQPNSKKPASAPKSILKKTQTTSPSPASSKPLSSHATDPQADRNRQLAIHHATLLQQRKDTELDILSSLEELIDSPSSATTDPQNPANHDRDHALQLLQPFQPADFDSLVEERNIDNRCGYVLCPRPPRREKNTGKFRILRGGSEGIKIVDKKDYEKWCSDLCGKHALYLRVQMSDVPAWERQERQGDLELYGAVEAVQAEAVRRQSDVDGLASGLNELAIERGDNDPKNFRSKAIEVNLKERVTFDLPVRPPNPAGNQNAIEGYKPQFKCRQQDGSDDSGDEDDVMDTL